MVKKNTQLRTTEAKKALLAALERTMGIVSPACKISKVARRSHYEWLERDVDYKLQVEALADHALDFAESCLMKSIKNGSDTATIFYLKTKGKKRGYIERQELTGEDGKNLFAGLKIGYGDKETDD